MEEINACMCSAKSFSEFSHKIAVKSRSSEDIMEALTRRKKSVFI